ncbi:MAG: hypothetical protein E7214_02370 [Clostridium sp.]|nr:hypothetical protein [Clostridium sp.]
MDKTNILIESTLKGNKNYFSINISEDTEVLEFEVNMIKNNITLGFLEVEERQIDNNRQLLFSNDLKMNLSSYISNEDYGIEELYEIIETILSSIETIDEFMLDNKKIVLDSDYIFIDKDNLAIYLMYIPIKLEFQVDIENQFKNLCKVLLKEVKEYKYELLPSERKVFNSLLSKSSSLKNIRDSFEKYKENYKSEGSEPLDNLSLEDGELEESKKYESVIEESYNKFQSFDDDELEVDDEDIQFKEFEDIMEYEKLKDNNKVKRLLLFQIIIVIIIAIIALVLYRKSIKMFLFVVSIIIAMLILLIYVLSDNNKAEEELE